ncbi:double-stranded RNA-binding protein 2-like [Aristolochia californica]|uniref:double-stranded RNA-binding protein 2-like n=1 Tax=Aristolochia californica TaxID=171875 RepID=UPI0035DB9C69
MYKNQLQELAQRSCFNLPSYACIREGPDHAPRFKATVNFNGEIFESPNFCSTLRQAEHAAAEVALNTLSKRGPSRSLAAKVLDETGVYKNLLQETAHRAGLNLPVYTTVRTGPGHVPVFSCTVELAGMSFSGEPAKTKKQAQKNAAMAAWSALKQLPRLTSSTSSSSYSTSPDSEGNEAQEQVIVARALASLSSPNGNKLGKQNDRHRGRRRQAPRRAAYQNSGVSLYSMPYQPWRYPNLSAELAMYQMWQHDPVSQQLNQLLTLPAPPSPSGPRILPIAQSMLQPNLAQCFPAREQHSIIGLPDSSIYLSDQLIPDSARSRSQVTIKEIHEEKTQGGSKDKVCGTSDGIGDPDHQTSNSFPEIQELIEGRQLCNRFSTTNMASTGREPAKGKSSSKLPVLFQNSGDMKKVEEKQIEGNEKDRLRWVSGVAYGSILDGRETNAIPTTHSSSLNFSTCYSVQGNRRQHHQSYVGYSGVSRGFSRPPSMAAPVTVRTAVPVYSPRLGPHGLHTGAPPVNSMAPAVQIRSVIPVCSAPPAPKVSAPSQEKPCSSVDSRRHESGVIGVVSSELGKLWI